MSSSAEELVMRLCDKRNRSVKLALEVIYAVRNEREKFWVLSDDSSGCLSSVPEVDRNHRDRRVEMRLTGGFKKLSEVKEPVARQAQVWVVDNKRGRWCRRDAPRGFTENGPDEEQERQQRKEPLRS